MTQSLVLNKKETYRSFLMAAQMIGRSFNKDRWNRSNQPRLCVLVNETDPYRVRLSLTSVPPAAEYPLETSAIVFSINDRAIHARCEGNLSGEFSGALNDYKSALAWAEPLLESDSRLRTIRSPSKTSVQRPAAFARRRP